MSPPTLRSAQSSPAGKAALLDVSPDIIPGRKAPKCSKCAQSRRGHPRSGCPDITRSKDINTNPTKVKLQENLSQALESMYLDPSVPAYDQAETEESRGRHSTEARALRPSDTLVSISPSAEDILHHLTRPGFFSQVTASKDDDDSKPSEGQSNTTLDNTTLDKLKMNSGPQILMPGTLKAPSWESSIEGLPDAEIVEKMPPVRNSLGIQTSFRDSDCDTVTARLQSDPSSPVSIPALPLQRSQTQEQRQLFLSSLSQASPASVYIHKRQDVDEVKVSAQAAKLHVQPIYSESEEEEDVLLVIGSDLSAVEELTEGLTKSIQDPKPNTANICATASSTKGLSSSSAFKAIASGAIMGAIGTWAGLAFS